MAIGQWVIREACRAAAGWPDDVRVAVTCRLLSSTTAELARTVAGALQAAGLAGQRLELEITETVLLQDSERVLAILHELRTLGLLISMDDFGTGYSSLGYLRRFPFNKIKIDRSFVRDLPDNKDAAAIVRAITRMSASLGMTTTAEGVETAGQLARLRGEGCTEVQGFLLGVPRPADEVWLVLHEIDHGLMPFCPIGDGNGLDGRAGFAGTGGDRERLLALT